MALKIIIGVIGTLAMLAGLIWFANLGGIKERIFVNQIVKMRVSPERLTNPKTPQDYGMAFTETDIMTPDGVRLSAWEIPAPDGSDKTIIMNHALGTTRYGAVEGLDGVSVEHLPMVKHLHDAGYNVVMYDHRGQGESDGGTGKTRIGTEAPVGVGATEWQDVIGSLEYVQNHPQFRDDQIAFLSQCMGASATFKAWSQKPKTFSDPKIRSVVAIQPPIAYKMNERFIIAKAGMDLVDEVLDAQIENYGFGFADNLNDIKSLTVPVLFLQSEADQYTFDDETGTNDVQMIFDAAPTEKELIWVRETGDKPHGTGQRFDGYGYFNKYPEELVDFFDRHFE
ncbi:alpha/beta hydrolase [Henriciella barbarensis]|uniref:Alpha/beta hydrolase n=1 Tax=Henriciella barbarensis TaxID=86342 RepID=A0A399R9D2_9PROT|nr:alpha/beta hydrolase [Henriciella barbarensis]RIJ26119.1 alpha/beta hydrolase [Henriciella barbarensis]